VYDASPDEYTILANGITTATVMEVGNTNLPSRVMDLSLVTMAFSTPMLLMVHVGSPFQKLEDIIAEARRDPGSFTWTSLGGVSVQAKTTSRPS
jgi:tripartite-type tricarboxylate transporter receptor subunit TctC